jgi:hypothetical protein
MRVGVKILTTLMEEVLAVHQKPERIRKVIKTTGVSPGRDYDH